MSAEPWAMVNQDESQDNEQLGLAECEQDEDQESQHLGEEVTSEEGSNNELFDCLVQITIAGQQLLVYHSSSRQCEWNIQGISNFFFRTADKKKATDLFRERKEIIMNDHRELWPGINWTRMIPRTSRRYMAGNIRQKQWFKEGTVSTSMTIAFALFCISHGRRQKPDRKHSCKWFARFLQKLFSTLGETDFQFCAIVTDDDEDDADQEWLTLTVDYDMRLYTRNLFSEKAFLLISEEWNKDLDKRDVTWITSRFTNPTIAEFLMFSFDPNHPKDVSRLLRGNALCLLTQIASLLDDRVQEMGAQLEDFEVSSYKQKPSAILMEQKRSVAERLWQSKETFLAFKKVVPPLVTRNTLENNGCSF